MRSKEHLLEKGMKTKVLTSLPTRTLSQVVLKPVLLPTRKKKEISQESFHYCETFTPSLYFKGKYYIDYMYATFVVSVYFAEALDVDFFNMLNSSAIYRIVTLPTIVLVRVYPRVKGNLCIWMDTKKHAKMAVFDALLNALGYIWGTLNCPCVRNAL